MRATLFWALLLSALPTLSAELKLDFGETHQGQTPEGFHSVVMGKGKTGDWKLILDDVPAQSSPLGSEVKTLRRAVLAQLAQDPADERFPMFIYEGEVFGDFTLTTRIKTVKGAVEQMAGIAFRIQNETNYYVVRASSLGNTFKFYKVVDGQIGAIVGPDMPIPNGVWHELKVECNGKEIKCGLDGTELISVRDKASALTKGKIGFWTKSDSVSYFTDTRITYTPFEPPAQKVIRDMLSRYPRLLGLKIYVKGKQPNSTCLIASKQETELGQPGTKTELEVIGKGETYFGKEKDSVSVIMPLRDRNGDAIAAVRVVMKSFPGQTEENAIIRAAPVVKAIQGRVQALEDLSD